MGCEKAVAPLRKRLGRHEFFRMVLALAIVIGCVHGLLGPSRTAFRETARHVAWAARAQTRAALDNATAALALMPT